ncbi:peptidylprolyl isomerase [Wolbachia endosymbiont of Cruorifilaria tuberocauda]|uniref:peptidylprolyl isomerase n=1 Tax=Wolbachia endosymbiont of Cruorifilaria tuberocauda TaxID=1812111 RepID=UPI00158DF830|nr:peptidylprolyl isomerase [Wolbachia endosymbiont of Cruorifilaria tuberocauda]QKX01851.1 peptidylprolyl isomerase [Wolbachia endosymbiont of Cruorifilaria tuberocauda]
MSAKNLFTKSTVVILACLLIFIEVVSFLSENSEREEVAIIGKEVITLDEYKLLYQNYEKQTPEHISKEQMKKLKHDLLNALIEQKLLFNLTSDLGLVVGEESVKDYIESIKHFKNDKGELDKEKFYEMLNELHIIEKDYVAKLKKNLPAMMFMTCLFKNNYPMTFGKKVDEQIYKNRHQTRIVDIVKITKDVVTDIPKPEDKALFDLYKRNKSHFYYPEYRVAQYISLGQKYFEDQSYISDEEVNNIIEQQKLKDQRDIFNLVFHTEKDAKEAKKALEKGKTSFEQVAEKFGKAKPEEIRVNNITKDSLPENMREKVFALKAGEVSEIFTSNIGWHIIKVENAYQISNKNLADLKKNIKSILVNQKSFKKANDFINQVNYKIYNGATIEEISNEYNLPMKIIGPVDASGKDQNFNSMESNNDLISFIFSQEKGQKSYFKDMGGTIISVKVIDITPPKMQNFEESKASVIDLWYNEFIKDQMLKVSQRITFQLKEKADFEKVQGVELIKDKQIQRNEAERQSSYPLSFTEEVFNMKTTNSVTNPIQWDNNIIIGILKEIHSSSGELNAFDIGEHVMISLKAQLISYLKSKYKVKINHATLDYV